MTSTNTAVTSGAGARLPRSKKRRAGSRRSQGARWVGWWFAVPALVMYAVFVIRPVASSVQISFYDWDGFGPSTWVGLDNYRRVFTDPELLATIGNAFFLIIFFTAVPVVMGLIIAALMREIKGRVFGATARTLLFLPQIIPGAAAAIAWTWMYSRDGVVNQFLSSIGLESFTRAWLGDFDWALPAVGFIGTWLSTGLCTLLLMAGIGKIDASLYEAARLDGANFLQQTRSVTLPGLKQELGVCVTITIIAALAAFDVVFLSTQGGPGRSTMVPGVEIYRLGFVENQLGLASALAVVLAILVLLVVGPLQRVFKER
ncbi:sugar ABC transporter permease [Arthrobacter sp. EH-1B-1]|uniref:Sugar ABC transporter permease n=1 Tax=Arthrobacter vasquezii TaxID=2977629 RepID=A0ABT6CQ14_9MICC|nr:sugar ABC transporter permease [Arthrobacter vasquezii]MDF9276219.1 sugar ABC transporter permease [Arthrobacter vasquezii]